MWASMKFLSFVLFFCVQVTVMLLTFCGRALLVSALSFTYLNNHVSTVFAFLSFLLLPSLPLSPSFLLPASPFSLFHTLLPSQSSPIPLLSFSLPTPTLLFYTLLPSHSSPIPLLSFSLPTPTLPLSHSSSLPQSFISVLSEFSVSVIRSANQQIRITMEKHKIDLNLHTPERVNDQNQLIQDNLIRSKFSNSNGVTKKLTKLRLNSITKLILLSTFNFITW